MGVEPATEQTISSVRLVLPSARFRESFLDGAWQFAREARLSSTYAPGLGFDNVRDLARRFDRFIDRLRALARGDRSPYVDRVLWLVDGDEYIGQLSIRPRLASAFLLTYGGHVGYSVRPDRRRRGYGARMLALGLQEARRMGLTRLLITCNEDNTASRKIIEGNGGCFERSLPMPAEALRLEGLDPRVPRTKLRYWFHLDPGTHSSEAWNE